jgi:general secretion pathway protein E
MICADTVAETLLCWACAEGASALRLRWSADEAGVSALIDGARIAIANCSPGALDAIARALVQRLANAPGEHALGKLLDGHEITFRPVHAGGGGRTLDLSLRERKPPRRSLGQLGFAATDIDTIARVLEQPQGLVLVAGGARSGRTSTLYAMLEMVDPLAHEVHTVESGVWRWNAAWQQIDIGPAHDAGASRRRREAIERVLAHAGPGVLMVDGDWPADCLRGLSGAVAAGWRILLPATLERAHHAFDHFDALGVAPAQMARQLSLVLAQRLARTLCRECAQPDDSAELRAAVARAANSWLDGQPIQARRASAAGCARCRGTGYRGQTLLYELLELDARMRALAADKANAAEMEQNALADGHSLWDQGIRQVAGGAISLASLRAALREPR